MLDNKLGITNEVELAKEEERITKIKALENGLIKMTNPDKPTSKNQMYYKV